MSFYSIAGAGSRHFNNKGLQADEICKRVDSLMCFFIILSWSCDLWYVCCFRKMSERHPRTAAFNYCHKKWLRCWRLDDFRNRLLRFILHDSLPLTCVSTVTSVLYINMNSFHLKRNVFAMHSEHWGHNPTLCNKIFIGQSCICCKLWIM